MLSILGFNYGQGVFDVEFEASEGELRLTSIAQTNYADISECFSIDTIEEIEAKAKKYLEDKG